MDLDVIFVLGPQGSGKGTQAKRLAEKLGFFFWETGAILREVSKSETPLGKRVHELIDQGILLPDDLLIEVVKQRLPQVPEGRGVVFDGIPRRMGQAEFLMNFLKSQNRKHFVTIFLDLPKEESIKRLLLRAQKEGRVDDTREAIEVRLKHYEEATKPMLEYMREHTTFITIDGRPPIEEVSKSIDKALSEVGIHR